MSELCLGMVLWFRIVFCVRNSENDEGLSCFLLEL